MEILFRASSIGNLMVESTENKITEPQLVEIKKLQYEKHTGVNENNNKVKWTETKENRLNFLLEKRDAPPQLSKTAKKEVEKVWRFFEKGYLEEINSKFLDKGLLNEDDGLVLLSEVLDTFLIKNNDRKTKNNITGECDVNCVLNGIKTIIDVKSCWDSKTFMNAEFSNLYEWQLRAYMYLYNVDNAILAYTLTDTPKHLIDAEKRKLEYKYYSKDMSDEELNNLNEIIYPLLEQIEMNLTYSNNPKYTKKERVKIFKISRDLELENLMLEKVKLALEYYKTITLNK